MKILVVTPKLPWPAHGADEQDRLEGIKMLKELGHEVLVIAKVAKYQGGKADDMAQSLGIPVVGVPYTQGGFSWRRFSDARWIDGAAFEYTEPLIRKSIEETTSAFKPELAWIDASFSWPLLSIFKKYGIRTIVRSLQIESTHILVDEGRTPLNYVRAFAKGLGEATMAKSADTVIAINRNEAHEYTRMGAKYVATVPLRSLPVILENTPIEYRDTGPLRILFSGSTFSVAHNKDGVMRVLRDIAPALEKAAPGVFVMHITGAKLPREVAATLPKSVKYEGYVLDYGAFMKSMDIAITPSLGRCGMHQKLFEPIARGIPTVTVPWALAGFPFEDGKEVVLAEGVRQTVTALLALRERGLRERIGRAGRALSLNLFSRERVLKTLKEIL